MRGIIVLALIAGGIAALTFCQERSSGGSAWRFADRLKPSNAWQATLEYPGVRSQDTSARPGRSSGGQGSGGWARRASASAQRWNAVSHACTEARRPGQRLPVTALGAGGHAPTA